MSQVKPYSPEGSKKEQVAEMFNAISPKYDALNRILSVGIDQSWRRKTVREIRATGATQILDVATGTADLALALADGIPGSKVVGVDISAGMLDVGRQKVRARRRDDRVRLDLGDGEQLPYGDAEFGAITVAFGVRNFEHLEQGLRDMHRVLQPGGTLAVLEFSQPTSWPFRPLYLFYFNNILPRIGRLISKDASAYTYLPDSVQAFPYGEAFAAKLQEAGFRTVRIRPLTLGIASLYVATK
ncbi:MAG: bifunctional demethylmenaquinone methyltransferase/2-methoxy-6-polyprenyl-1,4-benzoquinol methylase UbiE [Cryomorphaceae bacterium]|jgi:demethylmenaquinone methyltransferase/2-methoxy-6-polyprenyl-1,4-benzoquinol methylase|nr:bifunctional demethylmenaquinone methyltransferase/2-methoxy-6-polyprenyl-1,4-benzoquinol methylase UbiE [Cryomorphaceae bacterium]